MKLYDTLLALSKDERSVDLKASFGTASGLSDSKTELQKHVAKLFVAMIEKGDCSPGEMRKHGILITGEDIREKLQDIYGLVNVFQAVVSGDVEITEEEFDKMDSSKLALLSPFLTKPELKDKLAEAVTAAKTGTAKEIRDLKPKVASKAEKEVADLKAKLAKGPAGTPIEFGFIATDISADAPLISSKQAQARLKADFAKAMETNDVEGIMEMMDIYAKMFMASADSIGSDPKDYIDLVRSGNAKPAAGTASDSAMPASGQLVAA